ncbi:hypothetical protein D9619_013456 [Psilocybe cf. subviscida]|uniref:Uncharacterized protein n=1 Tax=Psilocybe cf. subviscida TaxID=2480587 RepID=A0A8H5BRE4_9AGAR|nr:hypothetical protein D9619_013456 [Psilocybe cf. subviscida]
MTTPTNRSFKTASSTTLFHLRRCAQVPQALTLEQDPPRHPAHTIDEGGYILSRARRKTRFRPRFRHAARPQPAHEHRGYQNCKPPSSSTRIAQRLLLEEYSALAEVGQENIWNTAFYYRKKTGAEVADESDADVMRGGVCLSVRFFSLRFQFATIMMMIANITDPIEFANTKRNNPPSLRYTLPTSRSTPSGSPSAILLSATFFTTSPSASGDRFVKKQIVKAMKATEDW